MVLKYTNIILYIIMKYQVKKNHYLAQGYLPTPVNNSGLTSEVFYKGTTAVRMGYDVAYDHYAKLILSNTIQSPNTPKIYNHQLPLGAFTVSGGTQYSCTEMELLEELSVEEARLYKEWIDKELVNLGTGKPVSSDPFKLEEITRILIQYAQNNNLGLDLVEPKNVMKRGLTYIHLDPFGQL